MAEQNKSTNNKSVSNELNAKLERRPSWKEAGHGVSDINISSTLHSTIKKLETEQKKDIVCHSFLCNTYNTAQKHPISD